MAVESSGSDKKKNGLQIFVAVLVLISMGLNVYLFRYYAEQNDVVEVMTSWEEANTRIQQELSSLTAMLVELETRQSKQEAITDALLEALAKIEARQMEEASQPFLEPDAVDQQSWEDGITQIREELFAIKAMLELILDENTAESELEHVSNPVSVAATAVPDVALNQDDETPDGSIQVMASASGATYVDDVQYLKDIDEHSCSIVEVKLLPGDSVWSIVARFKSNPSPALVNEVVEFNNIVDPKRLPVGFPIKVPMELVNGDLVP